MSLKSLHRTCFPVFSSILIGCATLGATNFTTTDIASYVNGNVQFNPQTLPTGTTTGNQDTGIPFDVPAFNGIAGNWSPYGLPTQVLDVSLHVSRPSLVLRPFE